ncbi:hypothetical protein MKZ38_006740 [Zalerion maritima]|uniref:Uncharacterized protein n=1 Tax=Zalerion maritima TaxID=339359 RepID=A0AAD5WPK9_9PEZI|nr:hypothetical protein MKZ38_006740 [Zalerion maritima]
MPTTADPGRLARDIDLTQRRTVGNGACPEVQHYATCPMRLQWVGHASRSRLQRGTTRHRQPFAALCADITMASGKNGTAGTIKQNGRQSLNSSCSCAAREQAAGMESAMARSAALNGNAMI